MPNFTQFISRFSLKMNPAVRSLVMAMLLAGGCLQAPYAAAQLCTTPPAVPCPSTTQVLTQQQAADLFNDLATNYADLKPTFKYPDDGCYARAHRMYQIICQTYSSWKVWNYKSANGQLRACSDRGKNAGPCSPADMRRYVEWVYHVAPLVLVKSGEQVQETVLDPSLFTGPVTVDDWQSAQNANGKGLGTLETTIPEIYYHPQGSDNDAGKNLCDTDLTKTKKVLKDRTKDARDRAIDLGLPPPAQLASMQFIVGIVQSFNESTGMLQIVGSPNTYTLNMGDPHYPGWSDFLTQSEAQQDYVYVAYDPSTFAVQYIGATFTETVVSLAQGAAPGTVVADFVIMDAGFTLTPSNPNYSQYLALLQQSQQNQTPLLLSADENELLLDVRTVPVK